MPNIELLGHLSSDFGPDNLAGVVVIRGGLGYDGRVVRRRLAVPVALAAKLEDPHSRAQVSPNRRDFGRDGIDGSGRIYGGRVVVVLIIFVAGEHVGVVVDIEGGERRKGGDWDTGEGDGEDGFWRRGDCLALALVELGGGGAGGDDIGDGEGEGVGGASDAEPAGAGVDDDRLCGWVDGTFRCVLAKGRSDLCELGRVEVGEARDVRRLPLGAVREILFQEGLM